MRTISESLFAAAMAGLLVGGTRWSRSQRAPAGQNIGEKASCKQKGTCSEKGTCNERGGRGPRQPD